ncbi:MAG TPA: TonB-dependent receptor [Longimicrobiales bacterium]|nr:TonB-dependent receptor [Longimicrobiales bacterium]
MLGKAVVRIASTLAAALLFVIVTVTSGHAQATTGKVQGRVLSTTGQPIVSAQVSIDGTRLGNITNDEGFYFINEVPAGVHTIKAQSIGYRTSLVTEQRVLAGQTHTINFELAQSAVELEPLTVIGERNPLVPRDQVSSRAIVTGEAIDRLPLDNSASIVVLTPGVITTNEGFSIRGSREGEHGVYIDGVPVRNLRCGSETGGNCAVGGGGQSVELGTNSLAQVDVTTGGVSARYGNAQSGLVNYVTRTGGSVLGGSVSFQTDRLTPEKIRGGFTRGEFSVGGPAPFVNNLSFFVGTTLEGRKYGSQPQGNPYPVFIAEGVDTIIRLARTGITAGATDSVDVVIPNFIEWDNGPTLPTGVSDEFVLTSKLRYGLGRGSNVDLTWHFNRNQSISRGTAAILNPDAWSGSYSTNNMLTLGGYFMLMQTAESQLALDVKASFMRDWAQSGQLERDFQESALFPALGFNARNLDFIWDPDDYPVTDEMLIALRSGVLPTRILSIMPGRSDLTTRQGVAGVSQSLRVNPYAMRSGWTTSGIGNVSQAYTQEDRVFLTASADWQINRWNRLQFGGEATRADSRTMSVPLYDGMPGAAKYEPTTAGLFAINRLDIGDVVLEGGLRMDYYDPNSEFPRLPGFVTNLPDSLKADAWRLRPVSATNPDEPWDQRLERVEDCGGAATAAARTSATTGQPVCKANFLKAQSRTAWSPKLSVSFPVTATSTFRLNYSHNTQPVGLTTMFRFALTDLAVTNTNAQFGRDVELPKTVQFEAGYRQVFGGNTVIDAAAYSKTTRNNLTFRKEQYINPVTRASTFLNVLTNADYSLARGVDLRLDRKVSGIVDMSFNYSFVDSRGTGSDPFTYTGLIFRRNTNLSILTGQPVDPPEVLLPSDQSRAHNLSTTISILFGDDYAEDSRVGNMILGDLGVFATGRMASGLPYTRLVNVGDGQRGPPTVAGLGGIPAEQLNASRGPGFKAFDLRLTKGFTVMGRGARAFADMRNPFNIATTNQVFMETGTIENDVYWTLTTQEVLNNQFGIGTPRDMVISQWPENEVNRYMLAQAETRWGNGDGVFTVAEMENAWMTYQRYASASSAFRLRTSNQSLRFGLEVVF